MMSSLNESSESTHLELLPAELQCQILTSLPNMQALRALLAASPRYFRLYRTCRELVLSHVAWNHITPTAVSIALCGHEQRELRKHGLHPTEKFTPLRRVKGPHEIPLEIWKMLLRFHQIVDRLISNFTSSRLVALENSMHPQTQTILPHEPPGRQLNLSQLEYARLTRAFYHLDLYAYFHDADLQDFFQARTYLQSLRDCELEELLCVRSYMMERVVDYLNKFEDDFMKAYLKDKPFILWPSSAVHFLNWRVDLFADKNHIQRLWVESCLVRGLESLSAMFSADKLPNKFQALRYLHPYRSHLMSMALNRMRPYSGTKATANMEQSCEIGFYDNIEQPNEAWFWAIKFCGKPRIDSIMEPDKGEVYDGQDTNDFERWGYVIWDHARLERLGILTKSPSDISATIGADWLIKRTPKSLERRTREKEKIFSQEGPQSTLNKPRTLFDWEKIWFK